jgi:hypothetical protein
VIRAHLLAFAAGFVSTLVFHQGALAILHALGAPRKPFMTRPTWPFGIPEVISLALWGGVWGIALWLAIMRLHGATFWLAALAIGAIAPSIVALFVVMPLKGLPVAGGWDPKLMVGALILNGAWGIGVALLMRLFARLPF